MGRLLLLACALAAAACGEPARSAVHEQTPPPEAHGLRLTLESSARELDPGDVVQLQATLTNLTPDSVVLSFPNSCRILVFVEDREGTVVLPDGGRWLCLEVATTFALAPGERRHLPLPWTGRRDPYDAGSAALPAGEYRAYATLHGSHDDREIRLRSEPVTLTLRPADR